MAYGSYFVLLSQNARQNNFSEERLVCSCLHLPQHPMSLPQGPLTF